MDKKRHRLHYAWVILLAVSLIRGVAGPAINASSGVFLTPVSQSLGVGVGQLSLYLSVSSVVTLLWLPVAGGLYNKYRVRTVVALGVLLQTLAFMALGLMKSVWGWYLLAVPLAMGGTLLVNLLGPLLVGRWFAKNVGLVMGIMMMVTSLLGAALQPLLTTLIATTGWRATYLLVGGVALVVMLAVGLPLLKNSPAQLSLQPYGTQEAAGDTAAQRKNTGVSAKTALKAPAFYCLLLFMVVLTGFAAFQQHVATFGLGLGLQMSAIGTALAVSMVGAAIGSVLIGLCSDKLGVLPTSLAVLAVGGVALVLFYLGGGSFMMFAAAAFLHGLATSAIGVVAPLLTTAFFGGREYEKLFAAVMTGSPLASVVLLPAYGFLYDAFGNYNLVLVLLLGALAVAAAVLLLGYRNSRKLWQQ